MALANWYDETAGINMIEQRFNTWRRDVWESAFPLHCNLLTI